MIRMDDDGYKYSHDVENNGRRSCLCDVCQISEGRRSKVYFKFVALFDVCW